jgi:hypothetical protein
MIKFEHTEVLGWEHAIRGMRNPMNSWEKSDSAWTINDLEDIDEKKGYIGSVLYKDPFVSHIRYELGRNDQDLMMRLRNAGTDHRKFMRMIVVYCDITAPLYWWKEFDTYKVGTVANSCSTMHKIAEKEFTLEDFSCEHLERRASLTLAQIVDDLNFFRTYYLRMKEQKTPFANEKAKQIWWQMIQLLPSSYNQRRTVMLNYEVLANIYKSRRNHKLDEWCEHKEVMPDIDSTSQAKYAKPYKEYVGFCDWIKTLPYSELITGSDVSISHEEVSDSTPLFLKKSMTIPEERG